VTRSGTPGGSGTSSGSGSRSASRVRFWGKALTRMPRLDAERWGGLDPVARWLVAARAAVLVMTLTSAFVAGVLAFRDGAFDGLRFVLVAIGLAFSHATNNLVNDLTDHARGVDDDDYFRAQYGAHPLSQGLMSRGQMLRYIAFTGAIAIAAGLWLVVLRGGATLALMGVGVIFVLFYTWPMKIVGLGEPAVLVVWGPLMVGGGYYVITGHIDAGIVLASLPLSLGASTVIFGKHVDKLEQDRAKGIRTLPVILGEVRSRAVVRVMLVLQYGVTALLVARGDAGPAMALVLFAAPTVRKVLEAYRHPRPAEPPPELPRGVWPLWYVALAFHHTRRFGTLYVGALLLDAIMRRVGGLGAIADLVG
jgi:1,4-dihydroxy-2-naphthoate polyprenyltransferase